MRDSEPPVALAPTSLSRVPKAPTRSLCIAGGKGGTGKSTVCAALAVSLARGGRVLLVDGDLGVGNAHLLQDVVPEHSLVDVVAGRISAREALVRCPHGLDLLAGGSGYADMASLSRAQLARLALGVAEIEPEYAWLLVDAAAGLSRQTMALAAASERVLLVATPDVTALTDAYAFLKVLLQSGCRAVPELVLNRCRGADEAAQAEQRVTGAARRFLGLELACVARLPEDEAAWRSSKRREPVTVGEAHSALGTALERLATRLVESEGGVRSAGWGASLLGACAES